MADEVQAAPISAPQPKKAGRSVGDIMSMQARRGNGGIDITVLADFGNKPEEFFVRANIADEQERADYLQGMFMVDQCTGGGAEVLQGIMQAKLAMGISIKGRGREGIEKVYIAQGGAAKTKNGLMGMLMGGNVGSSRDVDKGQVPG